MGRRKASKTEEPTSKTEKPTSVRLPLALVQRLEDACKVSGRNTHAEILHRLSTSLGSGPERALYGRDEEQAEQNLALGRLVALLAARLENLAGGDPELIPTGSGQWVGLVSGPGDAKKLNSTTLALVARSLAIVFEALGAKDAASLDEGHRAIAGAVARQLLDDLRWAGFLAPAGLRPEEATLNGIYNSLVVPMPDLHDKIKKHLDKLKG